MDSPEEQGPCGKNDIDFLLDLLDDDDAPAALAMADLLQRDSPELDSAIRARQGSRNTRLRRRIHQLESVLLRRRRRQQLVRDLEQGNLSLFDACVQLHISWFDNDQIQEIVQRWNALKRELAEKPVDSIRGMAEFLQKKGFQTPERNEMDAEYFCIGNVLDEGVGADLMLSAMACMLGETVDLQLEVVRRGPDFGFTDCLGRFVLPSSGWNVLSSRDLEIPCTLWRKEEILKFILSLLYLCAVGTDSFRYLNALGGNLAASAGLPDLQFLPYPYNAIRKDDRKGIFS